MTQSTASLTLISDGLVVVNIVPSNPAQNYDYCPFQHGRLGLEPTKLRGNIVVKIKNETDGIALQPAKITCRLCIDELSTSQGNIQHFDMRSVAWSSEDERHLNMTKDGDTSTYSCPFELELPDDAPHCFHADGANLQYTLSAFVQFDKSTHVPFESQLQIHVNRFTSENQREKIANQLRKAEEGPEHHDENEDNAHLVGSTHASSSLLHPEPLKTYWDERLDLFEYQVYFPKRIYSVGEIIPMAIVISPHHTQPDNPRRQNGVRNVSAQLIRRIVPIDKLHCGSSTFSCSSIHSIKDVVAKTGKACRFSNSRSIRLRLYLRIPSNAEAITQTTSFQRIAFFVQITIGTIGDEDDVVLEREVGLVMDPDIIDSCENSSEHKDDVVSQEKRQLPWDIDIGEEFDGYDDGVGDRIEEDPAPEYEGISSNHDTALQGGSNHQKLQEAFGSSVTHVDVERSSNESRNGDSLLQQSSIITMSMDADGASMNIEGGDMSISAPPYPNGIQVSNMMVDDQATESSPMATNEQQTYFMALRAYEQQQLEVTPNYESDYDSNQRRDNRLREEDSDLPAYGDVNSSISVDYTEMYAATVHIGQDENGRQQSIHIQHHRDEHEAPPPPPSPPPPISPISQDASNERGESEIGSETQLPVLMHPSPTYPMRTSLQNSLDIHDHANAVERISLSLPLPDPSPPPPPVEFVRVGEHGRLIAVESIPPPYRE